MWPKCAVEYLIHSSHALKVLWIEQATLILLLQLSQLKLNCDFPIPQEC